MKMRKKEEIKGAQLGPEMVFKWSMVHLNPGSVRSNFKAAISDSNHQTVGCKISIAVKKHCLKLMLH